MRLTNLAIIGILLVTTILTGCSSNQNIKEGNNAKMRPDIQESNNTKMRPDLTEEQRTEMIQDRLDIAKKSCENKQEGDLCTIKGKIGEIESFCEYQEDLLICKMNNKRRE